MGSVLADRRVFVTALIAAAVFGYLSFMAITTPEYVTIVEKVGEEGSFGYVEHESLLKNNSLYGSRLSAEKYPLNLVEELNARYLYATKPGWSGSYKLTGRVIYASGGTVLWEDELFVKTGTFANSTSVAFSLNVPELRERIKNVTAQLGVMRLSTQIVFDFSAEGERKFEHEFRLVMDPTGLLYFEGGEKSDVKPIVLKNEVPNSVFGIDIRTARIAFVPLFAIAAITAAHGASRIVSARPKRIGIERYVVDGRFPNVEKVVMLESVEDLKRTFELVDKPVVRCTNDSHEVYAIIDDGVAYVYRREVAE